MIRSWRTLRARATRSDSFCRDWSAEDSNLLGAIGSRGPPIRHRPKGCRDGIARHPRRERKPHSSWWTMSSRFVITSITAFLYAGIWSINNRIHSETLPNKLNKTAMELLLQSCTPTPRHLAGRRSADAVMAPRSPRPRYLRGPMGRKVSSGARSQRRQHTPTASGRYQRKERERSGGNGVGKGGVRVAHPAAIPPL